MKRIRLAGIVTLCALIPLLAPTVLVVFASLSQGELLTFPPRVSNTRVGVSEANPALDGKYPDTSASRCAEPYT